MERSLQRERKKAMLAALHDITHDPDVVRSPSQRVKLILATRVLQVSKIGRKGPAEGSVLDSRSVPAIQRHVTAPALDAQAIRMAMISASLSPVGSSALSPISSEGNRWSSEGNRWTDAIDDLAYSPKLHRQVRRWQTSSAILQSSPLRENSSRRSGRSTSRGPVPLSSLTREVNGASAEEVGRSGVSRPRTRGRSVEDRRTDPEVYVRTEAKAEAEAEAAAKAAAEAAAREAAAVSAAAAVDAPSVDLASVTLGATSVGVLPVARSVSTATSDMSFMSARSHLTNLSGGQSGAEIAAEAIAEASEAAAADGAAVPSAPVLPVVTQQASPPVVQFTLPPVEVPTGGEEAAVEEAAPASEDLNAVATIMSQLVGSWKNVHTSGLEPYLKHIGVGWAKRKVAVAFKPQLSFALVDGVLQCLMPSPVGERLERFALDEDIPDTDPVSGQLFLKRTHVEGATLHTVARDAAGKKADFVTTRYIDEGGRLIQTTSHGPASFERVFVRKA